jgi:molybdopterin-binding protein
MPRYRIGQAADLLRVSTDTVRRWADAGRLQTVRTEGGQRLIEGDQLAVLAVEISGRRPPTPVLSESTRNRFEGLVTKVIKDKVMAHVEIQAGPHRIVSLMSREAADELGLVRGVHAVAAVKATNVTVELPAHP